MPIQRDPGALSIPVPRHVTPHRHSHTMNGMAQTFAWILYDGIEWLLVRVQGPTNAGISAMTMDRYGSRLDDRSSFWICLQFQHVSGHRHQKCMFDTFHRKIDTFWIGTFWRRTRALLTLFKSVKLTVLKVSNKQHNTTDFSLIYILVKCTYSSSTR